MQGNIVAQGVELMLYGMGTVVLFLCLLVVATMCMSGLITRFLPERENPPVSSQGQIASQDSGAELDPSLVAAIVAAVQQHRIPK